jgi:hypothetical protein
MTPNRVVALLTPLVFAPLAGAVTAWLAKHAPGVDVDQDKLQQIFIAGAVIALAPAAQWLHGWQKWEERQAAAETAVQVAAAAAAAAPAAAEPELEPELGGEDFGDGQMDEADEFDMLDEQLAGDRQTVGTGS